MTIGSDNRILCYWIGNRIPWQAPARARIRPHFGGTGNILDDAGKPKETPMDPTQAIADYIEKERKTQLLRDEAQRADPSFT